MKLPRDQGKEYKYYCGVLKCDFIASTSKRIEYQIIVLVDNCYFIVLYIYLL